MNTPKKWIPNPNGNVVDPIDTNSITRVGMGEYDEEESEVLKFIEAWKKKRKRKFINTIEILRLLKAMGYRKLDPTPSIADVD